MTNRVGNEIWVECGDKIDITEKGIIDLLKTKLAAYEDAEEQGRLIVLPCKVGDVMYYIYGGYYKPKDLCTVSRPCKVNEISIKIVKGKMNYGFILDNGSRYSFSSIGKTVFLSREEAEKALEGKNNG